MKIRILSGQDIDRALSMAEAIEVVKNAFVQLSLNAAQSPVRSSLKLRREGDVALVMPAFLAETGALGAKIVSVLLENPKRGLPAVQALVTLFDVETGGPSAILEGTHLTRLRTGAATGAATMVLSRSDSENMALFGAGGQSFFQVQGVLAAREIKQVRVYDPVPGKTASLLSQLEKGPLTRGVDLLPAASPEQALEGADIIVTVTNSNRPVFKGTLLREGSHINAIGGFKPEIQEVDEETILRSRLFVDSRQACLEEAGDLLIPLKRGTIQETDIQAELGEVIAGKKPGRKTTREITFFKSVGNAVQDVSVAYAVLVRAREKGLGREIELE